MENFDQRLVMLLEQMRDPVLAPGFKNNLLQSDWGLFKVFAATVCTKCSLRISGGDVVWIRNNAGAKEFLHNCGPCNVPAQVEIEQRIKILASQWAEKRTAPESFDAALAIVRLGGLKSLVDCIEETK